jgi:2'-hydroxyisoflavone reductase
VFMKLRNILTGVIVAMSLNFSLQATPIEVTPEGVCQIGSEKYPAVGFGTFPLKGEACFTAVEVASELGYRIIDTATYYGNLEPIGNVLKKNGRNNFYVISKVWPSFHTRLLLQEDLKQTLEKLQTNYLDAYFLHWPNSKVSIEETLSTLDEFRVNKLIRHIGLSNVNSNHLKRALELKIPITWVQVEMNPFYYDPELLAFCKSNGITVQAWAPLGRGRLSDDALLANIGKKYGKTPSQVAIKWIIQHGCLPLPASKNPKHIKENIDVMNFVLTESDMEEINERARLGQRERVTLDMGAGFADEFDFTYEECWPKSKKQMQMNVLKVLLLGGTSFLGPHLVDELLGHGHEVTLFNRGTVNKSLFPNVETLQGNRDGDLHALKNRSWDVIIDTSGHLPRVVEASSKILSNAAKHYTFISTIGVYENFHSLNIDESYPLAKLEDETKEEINEKTYGALKAACEKVVEGYFPDHFLVIRPGLIVGPRDPTNRFSYWPLRVLDGGEILAPGSPTQNVQFIDVRDLAKWIVTMVENQATGFYNATGPEASLSFEELLQTCTQKSNKDVLFTWVDEDFLIEHGVQDWTELPLWLSYKRKMPGFLHVNVEKARQAGLEFRPLTQTIETIIDWEKQNRKDGVQIGMDRKKEQELLQLWKQNS